MQAAWGPKYEPHQYTYKTPLDPEQDTVAARENRGSARAAVVEPDPTTERQEPPETGMVLRLAPDELLRQAPRLKPWLRRSDAGWREIVDAAGLLRAELEVSKPLWVEACQTMGQAVAAIAIAIVFTKDPAHFRTSAGGTFMAWCGRPGPVSSTLTERFGKCVVMYEARHNSRITSGVEARGRARGPT